LKRSTKDVSAFDHSWEQQKVVAIAMMFEVDDNKDSYSSFHDDGNVH
jgi:hypothetical protein